MKRRVSKRPITSEVSETDLLCIEREQKRRKDRPVTLPLRDIHVADQVFQWRNRAENLVRSMGHLDELTRVLKATKKPLDPVVVTAVGDKFYVLEGHHRLEAYRAIRWRKAVPVKYFEGTVAQARDEALRLNIKDKLPLSRGEKFDAAFRMVKRDEKTYEQIKDITTVSVRTIATMAGVLRDHPEAKDYAWGRARALQFPKREENDRHDWREEKAQKLAKQLIKNVGVGFVRDADITARALEIIDENLPAALVREWPDRAQEVLIDVVREENEKLAEELERALFYPTAQSGSGEAQDL
jgi:hypothetical protein